MTNKPQFDFCGKVKTFVLIPTIIFVVAIVTLIIFGMEVAIEFRGGTMITYSFTGDLDTGAVETAIQEGNYGSSRITTGSAIGSDVQTLTVSFASDTGLSDEEQAGVNALLIEKFAENNLKHEGSQDVSPSTGFKFFLKCIVAVIFSFIVLVIYIGFRFKKIGGISAGVFALVALLTDVFMVIATFVYFRLSIDANFMAVVLTVLGYSINNTIVIYDRIRENRTLYGNKLTHRELVNKSISQSMTRSVNTTITTGSAVAVICIIAVIFGINPILSFAFPMLVGLGSGIFSSLCLSGPLWVAWQERFKKEKVKA